MTLGLGTQGGSGRRCWTRAVSVVARSPGGMWAPLAGGSGPEAPSPSATAQKTPSVSAERAHLPSAAGAGSCVPGPLEMCGEITSVPVEASGSRPAQPFGGNTLPSALIAPRWIPEVLWIVQQAYCH